MREIILISIIIGLAKLGLSQNYKVDTLKLIHCAKLQTVESQGAFFNKKELEYFIDNELSAIFLKSKGFQNVSFILIEQRNKLIDTTNSHLTETF